MRTQQRFSFYSFVNKFWNGVASSPLHCRNCENIGNVTKTRFQVFTGKVVSNEDICRRTTEHMKFVSPVNIWIWPGVFWVTKRLVDYYICLTNKDANFYQTLDTSHFPTPEKFQFHQQYFDLSWWQVNSALSSRFFTLNVHLNHELYRIKSVHQPNGTLHYDQTF